MDNNLNTPIFSFGGNNNVLKFLLMDLSGLAVLDFQAKVAPYNNDFDNFVEELQTRFGLEYPSVEWYKSHSNVSVQFSVLYADRKGPGYCAYLHNEAIAFIVTYFTGNDAVQATEFKVNGKIYDDRD